MIAAAFYAFDDRPDAVPPGRRQQNTNYHDRKEMQIIERVYLTIIIQ